MLLELPVLFERADIIGGQLADIAVGSGHFEETSRRAGAACAALNQVDFLRVHFLAALRQRKDELVRRLVIGQDKKTG